MQQIKCSVLWYTHECKDGFKSYDSCCYIFKILMTEVSLCTVNMYLFIENRSMKIISSCLKTVILDTIILEELNHSLGLM